MFRVKAVYCFGRMRYLNFDNIVLQNKANLNRVWLLLLFISLSSVNILGWDVKWLSINLFRDSVKKIHIQTGNEIHIGRDTCLAFSSKHLTEDILRGHYDFFCYDVLLYSYTYFWHSNNYCISFVEHYTWKLVIFARSYCFPCFF